MLRFNSCIKYVLAFNLAASFISAQITVPPVFYPISSAAALPASCVGAVGWVIVSPGAGSGNIYTCVNGVPALGGGGGGSTAPLTLVPTAITVTAPVLVNQGTTGTSTYTYQAQCFNAVGDSQGAGATASIANGPNDGVGQDIQITVPSNTGCLKYMINLIAAPSGIVFLGPVPDNGGATTLFSPGQVIHDTTGNSASGPFTLPQTAVNHTAGLDTGGSLRVEGSANFGPADSGHLGNFCPTILTDPFTANFQYFPDQSCAQYGFFANITNGDSDSTPVSSGASMEFFFTGKGVQAYDYGLQLQSSLSSPTGDSLRLTGFYNYTQCNAGSGAITACFGQINQTNLGSGTASGTTEGVRGGEFQGSINGSGASAVVEGSASVGLRSSSGDISTALRAGTFFVNNNGTGPMTGKIQTVYIASVGDAGSAEYDALYIDTITSSNTVAKIYGINEQATGHNYLGGNTGIGVDQSATAREEIGAGSANLPPFVIDSGTLKSSPASGAIENDGTNFYGTEGGVRHIFLRDQVATCASLSGVAPSCSTDATNASNIASGTLPTGRLTGSYTGITGVGTLTAGATGAGFTMNLAASTISGALPSANAPSALSTGTNCANGAAPAVCGTASSGAVAIPTGVTTVTLTVNTSAVTANSRIFLASDDSVTISGVTCNNTLATLVGGLAITGRVPGTSFTVTYNGTIAANPLCMSFAVIN